MKRQATMLAPTMQSAATDFEEVLGFWFGELAPDGRARPEVAKRWFQGGPAFDAQVRERFAAVHAALAAGGNAGWLVSARGRLAAVIVLDQFPRNMFRDTPAMFASDARALEYAFDAIDRENDKQLATEERTFLYMPLMHSEKLSVQERCVDLFASFRDSLSGPARDAVGRNLEFALRHRDIIRRFARFPHRNAILGRPSTPEEQAFLKEPGSSF
ncbi:MAG TPA: DUF924 family protein [Polyangiaceae bacterium]|nr:DUF924 family protein [Polyangiaceae bacterium]